MHVSMFNVDHYDKRCLANHQQKGAQCNQREYPLQRVKEIDLRTLKS